MAQLFIISIIRGDGDDTTLGISTLKCSTLDWILFSLLIFNAIVMEVVAIVIIKKQTNKKIDSGYRFVSGDIRCTVPVLAKLIIFSLFAGFASSALGAGLALILAPILLQCGLDPVSVAATEINQAFYSTITSTMIVIVTSDIMPYSYAWLAIIMCVIGAFGGIKA